VVNGCGINLAIDQINHLSIGTQQRIRLGRRQVDSSNTNPITIVSTISAVSIVVDLQRRKKCLLLIAEHEMSWKDLVHLARTL
jgi:hypothetical protein